MKLYAHTSAKKIIAALLILLFLQIYVVKIFHSHHYLATHTVESGIHLAKVNVSTNAFCAICDYQLAKDTDHSGAIEFSLSQDVFNVLPQVTNSTPKILDRNLEISSRGPPSL